MTLIELVVAVAIVAILTALALPAYNGYVHKSRRAEAMNALARLRVEQEAWRLKNPAYAADPGDLDLGLRAGDRTAGGYYRIAITAADAAGFTATATPAGPQRGDGCGTFAVNAGGPVTGGGFAGEGCWRR